jgi:diguanylate cyclase (GGDEF)-like protein
VKWLIENSAKTQSLLWIGANLLITFGIGLADFKTGREFSFSIFYLLPIVVMTWFYGRNFGFAFCIIATITWFVVDSLSGHGYSRPIIGYWNAIMRLGFFMLVALLLPVLQELEREKHIARLDDLTGISNRRHFFELAQTELSRSQRYKHPFTLAYIDLDGFKAVNDRYGHQAGDKVLCAIVNNVKKQLRSTDIAARMGGDEFILLLPEMDHSAAQGAIDKIRLSLLKEMRKKDWPVTFSIGVLTYQSGEVGPHELVRRADKLMYAVKTNGKNAVSYGVFN